MNRSFPFVYKLLLRISLLVCIFNLVPGAPHIHCSQYLDSHATTSYTTLWEPTVVPANLTLAEDRCQKTVAFAFLAQSGLPLRSIWQEYFDTCLPGHYLTLVHTGDPDAWHGERFMNDTIILPPELTVPDASLRYGYEMVDATLNLMSTALEHTLPQSSCRPAWVHILSDSCIPLTDCSSFQHMLAVHAEKSFVRMDKISSEKEMIARTRHVELSPDIFRKNSPWLTMRAVDIQVLLAKRSVLQETWKRAFVPSEHFFSVNFLLEDLPTWERQLTFTSFGNHSMVVDSHAACLDPGLTHKDLLHIRNPHPPRNFSALSNHLLREATRQYRGSHFKLMRQQGICLALNYFARKVEAVATITEVVRGIVRTSPRPPVCVAKIKFTKEVLST